MARRIVQRGRRTHVPKPVYLPEATESANAVGHVLVRKYGQQAWILQIMEMIQAATDRGIKQLSGSHGPMENAQPFQESGPSNPYRFGPRSPEEVQQDAAAHQAHQPRVPTQMQQQAQQAVEAYDRDEMDLFAQLAQVADPAQQLGRPIPGQPMPQQQHEQRTKGGLILPPGQPEPSHESADAGHSDDSLSWLF